MILLIDNVDSFVHNLERYFVRLGHETQVLRASALPDVDLNRIRVSAVVLSPGPGRPTENCAVVDLINKIDSQVPILGICLGHQQIAFALGGIVERSDSPVHGRASAIEHDGEAEFEGLANPFQAGRYHSLVVNDALPDAITVSARTGEGTVMAIRGTTRPLFGWQFHPESILSPQGFEIIAGFLRMAGLSSPEKLPNECLAADKTGNNPIKRATPITF